MTASRPARRRDCILAGTDRGLHRRTSVLILLMFTAACTEPHGSPNEYSLVARVVSPDHRSQAMLIRQRSQAALNSDVFFVAIRPGQEPYDKNEISNVRVSNAVLYATKADSVRLAWPSDSVLTITCERCGMESIDIIRERPRFGSVRVSFVNFPPPGSS